MKRSKALGGPLATPLLPIQGAPRGRRKSSDSPQRREKDAAIGRTLYRLLCWGYTMRSRGTEPGVAEVVGHAARGVLGLSDAAGRALGPDRIEQIFEQWFNSDNGLAAEPGGWRSGGKRMLLRPWSTAKVRVRNPAHGDGLVDRRPNWYPRGIQDGLGTTEEIVTELLRHGGKWPHGTPKYGGDLAPTAGRACELDRFQFEFIYSDDDKSG